MASIPVLNNGDAGIGSLRAAVTSASSGDTIDMSGLTGTITLASQIAITKDLTITGPGANVLDVDGGGANRIFSVATGNTLNVSDLEFSGGFADGTTAGGGGGAIYNGGTLHVSDSTFDGNNVTAANDTVSAVGGAILSNQGSSASLSILDCTFSGNSTIGTNTGNFSTAIGGAVSTSGSGSVNITNSTFNGNFARGGGDGNALGVNGIGGAVFLQNSGTTVLTNNTIVGNKAEKFGSLTTSGLGGGVGDNDSSTTTFTNNIIAQNLGNTADINIAGTLTTGGHNLIGISPGSIFVDGTNGDQVGTSIAPLDPLVSPLGSNGGGTSTMAILSTSPAINAGTLSGSPTLDQRGHARDGAVDIGAFEYQGATIDTASAATPSVVTGTTTALTVLGADGGGEAGLTYTWTATTKPTGSTVGFSVNASNAAKHSTATFSQAGTYVLLATISDGTTSTTSPVTVTVAQNLTTIVVSPAAPSLGENGTQQFTASAKDQFGTAMTGQPSFTWTKTTGVGAITTTGLYTAPATTGVATVRAASGSVNGSTSLTVTSAPPAFASTAITAATANDVYTYNITTANVGGNPVTITAPTLPAWLTLTDHTNGTATLSGTPDGTQGGANTVSLLLTQGQVTATQNFTINVDVPSFRVTTDGTLIVNGSVANDTISVWQRGTTIRAVRNGVIKNYALASITGFEVYGLDGNDTISVSTGASTSAYILGGAQNDMITGGDEYDNANGGGGKDTLIGGAGDDHLNGGDANDEIHGGDGKDRLYGGDGNDSIFGEAGSNHLWGGNGDDILFGGSSNDTLNGEAGDDQLNGGKGNDALHGGLGADTINGGAGTDSAEHDVLDQVTDVEVIA